MNRCKTDLQNQFKTELFRLFEHARVAAENQVGLDVYEQYEFYHEDKMYFADFMVTLNQYKSEPNRLLYRKASVAVEIDESRLMQDPKNQNIADYIINSNGVDCIRYNGVTVKNHKEGAALEVLEELFEDLYEREFETA
ncbi:hypothetical protein GCM10022378_11330 [Salinicoccus jeotgali]|uniref:Uncharacterized protein n=1 Tax=Salinicoccus jeotgali TaxID=381634 RepID=A0ABP7EQK8_9STAP